MLKQKPCGKGFLQLPLGKPAAHGVEWGADLAPGLMQNNMGIFLKEPSTSLGSRVHASAALGISACSGPQVPSLWRSLVPIKSHLRLCTALYGSLKAGIVG